MKHETYYVASKFEKKPEVRVLMHELRARGQLIVGDWTSHTVEGVTDKAEADALLTSFALEDMQAVERAHNLVLIHDDHCRGAFVELGIAIGAQLAGFAKKRIVVIGGGFAAPTHGPIFYYLPWVEHFADEVDFLNDLDRRL